MRAKYVINLIILDFTALTIFGEEKETTKSLIL